jgi:multimeric flavodoxin WrbA
MYALAVNGSPRKSWNTATLLKSALAGTKAEGAHTELVHLYDHDYTGCISCFACKKIGGKSYGRCAVRDGLTEILAKAARADVLILGSPIYFSCETGAMRSFMERLLFPYLTYTPERFSLFPRRLPTAFIYTMNVPEEHMAAYGQDRTMNVAQKVMGRIFGSCELLLCTDTYQFKDYSKYLCTCFDAAAKARRRREVFPEDRKRATALGARLAAQAASGAPRS